MAMTANEIRDSFLKYFESKGHKIVPSAPMVVKDDPTLMFTNAGMNQWKDIRVASQTIDSLNVINNVTNLPVLRPLCTYDKVDIIKISEKIGTYDISIRPYEDCCTIFAPVKPKTSPHLEECIKIESMFDFEPMIDECLDNLEVKYIKFDN